MMQTLMVAVTPVPSPTATVDPDLVTPGPWGFVVIAVLAVAVILLITDMMRRIRRGRVRADIREELDFEAGERAAVDADASDPEGERAGEPAEDTGSDDPT